MNRKENKRRNERWYMFERHYIVLEKKSELSIIFYNLEFFFSHN